MSTIKFPTKLCVFQPSRSKTMGENTFLAAKSLTFQKGKTHKYELCVKYIMYITTKTADT